MSVSKYPGISENGLYLYRATIKAESINNFDEVLNRISHQSEIMAGHRLKYIIPGLTENIYEIFLSNSELLVMMLSVPGNYHFIRDKEDQLLCVPFLRRLLNEKYHPFYYQADYPGI